MRASALSGGFCLGTRADVGILRDSSSSAPTTRCKKAAGERRLFYLNLLVFVLAVLVGNAAAGLAGGLARGLALAAAAVLSAGAEIAGLESSDLNHSLPPNLDFSAGIITRFIP